MMNSRVPEIRFCGFGCEWLSCKFSDMSMYYYGGGTPKTRVSEYWAGDIPWIQSSDVNNDEVFGLKASKFITEEAVNSSATKMVPGNSIAIVTRVGVGKLALMPYAYAASQDFISLVNLQGDKWFLVYSMYRILKQEANNVQGTSIKGITKDGLLKLKIKIPPSGEEQEKIGHFFYKLDNNIICCQQELNSLKLIRQGFLQKMFPKEGEAVPEIRFSEFTDDWEQRKLSEVKDVREIGRAHV